MKGGDEEIPVDEGGVSRVHMGGLDWRMRDRWRTISRIWEKNKAAANKLDLLGRLDYHKAILGSVEMEKILVIDRSEWSIRGQGCANGGPA